jgi:hypothetical protein
MIVYSSHGEVLVCENKDEKQLIKEFFTRGGRDLEDYDREVTMKNSPFVTISSRVFSNTE